VSFKYTDSIQRLGVRAQGLGKMMTNTMIPMNWELLPLISYGH